MKFETLCLHGGTQPDPTTLSRAVPVYRTSSYVFRNTEHAANLFALSELGNIYTRLMNPTTDVLEKRVALLEGAPEMGGLGVASGTSGVFYSIINLAQAGDNIVSRPQPLRRHLHPVQRHPARARHHGEVRGLERPAEFRAGDRRQDPRAVLRNGVEPGARNHRPRSRGEDRARRTACR